MHTGWNSPMVTTDSPGLWLISIYHREMRRRILPEASMNRRKTQMEGKRSMGYDMHMVESTRPGDFERSCSSH